MTFLELVQVLHRESGTGGPQPSTVISQVGEALRLVEWIRVADIEIQNAHNDWGFLWNQVTFDTVVDQQIYPTEADLGELDEDSFFIDSLGTQLGCVDYLEVKSDPLDTSRGVPYRVIRLPDRTLRVEAIPSAIYTIRYDYHTAPVELTDNDLAGSVIPEECHWAIVGKALIAYAEFENAPEIMAKGQRIYQEWIEALESKYLPGHRDMHRQAEGNHFAVAVE